jgi:hypothetical protein
MPDARATGLGAVVAIPRYKEALRLIKEQYGV